MELKINWDPSTNSFTASGRSTQGLAPQGDPKYFVDKAQEINSHVVASHNFSYAFIRDTFIECVNEYARSSYSIVAKAALKLRLLTLWCNIDSIQASISGIEDFMAKIDVFLIGKAQVNLSGAKFAIKSFINFLTSRSGNLMYGFGKVNEIISERLDFPLGAFFVVSGETISKETTQSGVKKNKIMRNITRFAPIYENKIINAITTFPYRKGKIAFLATNINGVDMVMSSQSIDLEKAFLMLDGYRLSRPCGKFNLCAYDDSSNDKWYIFKRQDIEDMPYSVFYL